MKKIVCALVLLLLLTGCGEEKYSRTFLAMDTVMTVSYYGRDDGLLDGAVELVSGLEAQFSVTDENSDLHRINLSGGGELSGDTKMLLEEALSVCRRTDGALDISLYPVLKAWGFTTGEHQVPEGDVIRAALEKVGYEKIALTNRTLTLPEGMELDFGAVAKGYTGNAILAFLAEKGVTSAILDLGGNIQTLGAKPQGEMWKVAVKDPVGDGYLGYLSLQNEAAITSGSYERFFEENGRRYWHILDRTTGCPADTGLISVTVVGENGTLCDGLSTALFVMGKEKGLEFWRNSRDFEAIFVEETGRITVTPGLRDRFQPEEGFTAEVAEG